MLIDKKILLVEDDEYIRQLFEIYLKQSNFVVVSAVDGAEAVEKFKQEFFDLVLLDILLPEKDGITVLKEMMSVNPKIGIVMLTNLANEDMIQQAFSNGAIGYLLKARVSKDDLLKEVQGFIDAQSQVAV